LFVIFNHGKSLEIPVFLRGKWSESD